ncbi:MAG: type II secretion system protein [Betaproteobacteria bacterium]|nr:type II secretion system protein [Betaproteobacteria bacterium]
MKRSSGFTLVEMAVVIFIITLLLGSILVPLATQVEQKQISDTQKTLDEIREALVGFALVNGYLPCPDTNDDGAEDVNAGTGRCGTVAGGIATGNLPWATVGVAGTDAWSNRFRYVLNERYAWRPPAALINLSGGGTDVRVCQAANCGGTGTAVVAVIVSHGKNGYGATNSLSGTTNPSPTGADELENTDADREVVSRAISAPESSAGEFDDIVTSLSQYILLNRMVAAGRLP